MQAAFNCSDRSSWPTATVSQLHSLPAELLRLQFSAKNLVTTGNKAIVAQRLYDFYQANIRNQESEQLPTPNASSGSGASTSSTSTTVTSASSPTTTGANLQLATLLLQAATQLSRNNQSTQDKQPEHSRWPNPNARFAHSAFKFSDRTQDVTTSKH